MGIACRAEISASAAATVASVGRYIARAFISLPPTRRPPCLPQICHTRVCQTMLAFANKEESNNNYSSNNIEEATTKKWENLYKNNFLPQLSASPTVSTTTRTTKSDIRIITFDLDNTLWKTSETISHANTALATLLQLKFGITIRSEVEMGRLFQQFPNRYCGLLDDDYDDENNNRGGGTRGGEESDDAYTNSVENVGRTEIKSSSKISMTTTKEGDDNGVHIQALLGKSKKKPVYLTLLRKDAIRLLILQQQHQQQLQRNYKILSPTEIDAEVENAFQTWMEARSQSISQNFVPHAVETLFQLKSKLGIISTSSSLSRTRGNYNKKVYIGAITDGNSNPQSVPELAGLFDFVIKAEDVGVSKPDKRVYKAAVAQVILQLTKDGRSVEQFFFGQKQPDYDDGSNFVATHPTYLIIDSSSESGDRGEPTWKDVDPDAVEAFSDAIGPWWVHIGDDFFKDVVAAKEFRMRSVWVRELIGGAKAFGGGVVTTDSSTSERKRSVEDLVNDIAKSNGAITMEIGDSDFLANALHEEFSDAILDRFADLSDLLIQWNEEGYSEAEIAPGAELEVESTTSEMFALPQNDDPERASSKYCMFCGKKVPVMAKFCPGCVERN